MSDNTQYIKDLSGGDIKRLDDFVKKKEEEKALNIANDKVLIQEVEGLTGLVIRLGMVSEEKRSELVQTLNYVIDSYRTRKCVACETYQSMDCKGEK